MKHIKKSFYMIRYNLKTLVGFELLFKLLSIFLFTPLFIHIFDFIMKVRGYHYLTFENIIPFFIHPLTICLLILLVLLMMIYTMFDITTIIIILDCSYQKKIINITNAIRISLKKCKTMFHFKNIVLAFFILFLIPFLNLGVSSSFISKIIIPEYILEFILNNVMFMVLVGVLVFFLVVLLFHWLYSIHYFVLEGVSYKEARRKSRVLGTCHHLKDWLTLCIIQVSFFLFYLLFIALGIFLIFLIYQFLESVLVKSFLTTILSLFLAISFLLFALLSTPISYAGISSLYYVRKEKKGEKRKNISIQLNEKERKANKKLKWVFISLFLLALGIGTIFTYGIYKGKYDLTILYKRETEVTAHRGASNKYPENTMAAFIGAKELGADYIELDVQQTKDGKIIVMHDKNLKRTIGFNKNVWDTTYGEIKNLDAGILFSEDFQGEKIPLLQDVVLWAKENNMKLNIELKPTGNEIDFEQTIIQILKDADYIDDSYVASQVYSVLENVKRIDASIKTIYVASVFYGNIDAFPYADDFSLEASNISKGLVRKAHKESKKVYAWTLNTEENMKKMINLNVDNLITDDVELAKETIEKSAKSDFVQEYIKWIEKLI